jgi:predicted unusual protein kinase regulating ubiquinone biosynthesis (AarF/ABC1/UbiB family)
MAYFARPLPLAALASLTLAGVGYHQYHNNHSFKAVCNLAYAGTRMALIYKYAHDSIEDRHVRACSYLRDALKDNGGIYLKLGQLIATLDVIVPD